MEEYTRPRVAPKTDTAPRRKHTFTNDSSLSYTVALMSSSYR